MSIAPRCLKPLALAAALPLALTACGGSDDNSGPSLTSVKSAAVASYADLMVANYSDVIALAEEMQTAIVAFVATPTSLTLEAARDGWLTARPYYQQSEVGRFYDGPIDDADGPEGDINAWPLDEGYIDYVNGNPTAGIVNDPTTYPTIDEALLRSLNGVGGEENVATGWHAIEFLLWGQDESTTGPGERPFEDYTVNDNATRRGTYLTVTTQMLVDDLSSVRDEWLPTTGAFRTSFLAQDVDSSLELILTGIATLGVGELRGERILVPFDSKSQEDEHSCFSDTTDLDHIFDGIGIRNIWRGEYDAADDSLDYSGTGLDEVFQAGSPTNAVALGAAVDAAVAALEAQDSPFDQAILGLDTDPGRVALQACLDSLSAFNIAISNAADALDLEVTSF